MKSIITKDFGISLAENFESAISNGTDFLYVMMGRSAPFLVETIEAPYDTVDYKNTAFKNGIVSKKVIGADVQPVIPRVDWVSSIVYVPYSETTNLFATTSETIIPNTLLSVASGSTANTVTANAGANFNTYLSSGDKIRIQQETREVAYISVSGSTLVVNSAFTSTPYTSQSGFLTNLADETWLYYNNFYVRNTYDQVFKCLFNANGAASTEMPEITLGGQLPENPYIETSDGYKWKYMYTIPSGLKKKFFTSHYMPVIRDTVVYNNAENGRIDIVKVTDGGSGYFSGGTTSNYPIVSVSGDGYGANFTVNVENGVITEVNVVDGGHDYTFANITISDPLQTASGAAASLSAVIGAQYGHGSDPVRELGGSFEMISVDFQGNLEGLLPVGNDFRQICLVRNPRLSSNSTTATGSAYLMCTMIYVENKPALSFDLDANVYVGPSSSPNFTAKVVYYDATNGILYLNNVVGDADNIIGQEIYQENSLTKFAQAFSVVKPGINTLSGEILYIENRAAVTRSSNQTETAKIVIKF